MLLGIDLGTSAIKVSVLDPATGRQVASATSGEMGVHSPFPGWAEQHPSDWWQGTVEAMAQIPAAVRAEVQAIGISYQMHGLVLIDDEGEVVRPSIIWCDGRAAKPNLCMRSHSDRTFNEPGNFTLTKLRWVFENEPLVFEKIAKAFLPGDYLAFRMTGVAGTTSTGLSEMIGWDFIDRCPSEGMWEASGARLNQRPDLVPIFGDQGRVTASAAVELGIPAGVLVTYRAGDQPNNALSLNVFHPGELAAVAGTSGVLYGVTDKPTRDPKERVNTFLHVSDTPDEARLGVLLCVNGAGAFYSWVRKTLGLSSFEELNALAAESPAGANGVVAIPFGNGPERSLGNLCPGAGFHGLDVNRNTRADLARAAMEGIVFAMRHGADVLVSMGLRTTVIKAGEGSMFRSSLFRSVFATGLDCELQILETDGALGAARAAGVGSGVFRSLAEAFDSLRVVDRVLPDGDLDDAYGRWIDTSWNFAESIGV